jgi:hypothetical protein
MLALATLGQPMTLQESLEWIAAAVLCAYLVAAVVIACVWLTARDVKP